MKKTLAILSALLVTLGTAGCNTMKGFGKDVERGGEKVQGAATRVQNGPSNTSSGTSTSGSTNSSDTNSSSSPNSNR